MYNKMADSQPKGMDFGGLVILGFGVAQLRERESVCRAMAFRSVRECCVRLS